MAMPRTQPRAICQHKWRHPIIFHADRHLPSSDPDNRPGVAATVRTVNDNISYFMVPTPAGSRLTALLIQTVTCLSIKSRINLLFFPISHLLQSPKNYFPTRKKKNCLKSKCQSGLKHICIWTKTKGLTLHHPPGKVHPGEGGREGGVL